MTHRLMRVFLCASFLLAGAVCSARTLTEGPLTFGFAPSDWTTTLVFPQFDPSSGQLHSVLVDLSGSISGAHEITNFTSSPADFTSTDSATFTLTWPDTNLLLALTTLWTTSGSITPNLTNAYSISRSGKSQRTFTGASDLAFFTGTGTVAFPLSAVAASSVAFEGEFGAMFSTDARASVALTYQFSSPEPQTVLLLGCALIAMGCLYRRKHDRS